MNVLSTWRRVIGEAGLRFALIARGMLAILGWLYVLGAASYLILRLLFGDWPWVLSLINAFSIFMFLPGPLALLIGLLVLRRKRWLLLAASVIAVVAVLWIGAYYWPKATAAAASTQGTTLRVATFNAWGNGNQHVADMEAWLRQINADVVFIQEKPRTYTGDLVPQLRDLYPYQFIQQCDDCIMPLSRYPFLSADLLPANVINFGDFSLQRLTIQLGGQVVAVYNVHLDSPFRDSPRLRLSGNLPSELTLALEYDDHVRNEQIRALLERLDSERA